MLPTVPKPCSNPEHGGANEVHQPQPHHRQGRAQGHHHHKHDEPLQPKWAGNQKLAYHINHGHESAPRSPRRVSSGVMSLSRPRRAVNAAA